MKNVEIIRAQLPRALAATSFPTLGEMYRGKVRDVYRSPERLVIITTDRVSAFDHVLGTIPFKGEILNAIAAAGFEATRDIAPNHVISIPDPAVLVAKPLRPYPVEFVVRGYITGSLWRDYQSGRAGAYGIDFPAGLRRDEQLPDGPILTPSTKAEAGLHDEPISKAEIVARGLMTAAELEAGERTALALFTRGAARAWDRGLILADTKYELGTDAEGHLTVIDEIHTPDSSRYWIADGYADRYARGEPQHMLDKEVLRQWLINERGFSGHGPLPALDDEIRVRLSLDYMALYERLLGIPYAPSDADPTARISANLAAAGLL